MTILNSGVGEAIALKPSLNTNWGEKNHPGVLSHFKVDAKDREYQFWERNALSVELNTLEMLKQKLEYIHYNPVLRWIM